MARKRQATWEGMFSDRVRPTESGCLEFTGFRNDDGYGAITHNNRRMGAHRLSYLLTKGEIPEGHVVMHSCDNPSCVNPAHLSVGLVRDNVMDMERKGRGRKRRGSDHSQAKLTEDDVRMIRASSLSGCALARTLGVTPCLVSRIRRGLSWVHVGESNVA